jgi:aspartyl-tRNA synthetase
MRTLIKETISQIGQKVTLYGWVNNRRDHGKIMFIDLRDRSGLIQLVLQKSFGDPKPESVIEVEGFIKKRPDNLINPKLETGHVEIEVTDLKIISISRDLPFPIDTDGYEVNEEIRTKYRYLDLRRPRMARNIRLRSKLTVFIRNYLTNLDFVEIETPILTKTTPEGARDFLVPSRLQPGKFYALPQSPQQYKQLLMVAGMERYFQIARCFRDEDPRKDRAYGEFTQLDMEMSFVTQEDIINLTEDMFTKVIKELFPEKHIKETPWPRIPHKIAVSKYGNDKPDLRNDKNDKNELAFAWIIDFPLFTEQSDADFYHGSGSAKFAPSHHMFTAPHPDDISYLDTDPMRVRGLQHDLVLNGFEVGGGSIRIHQKEIQEKVFDLIGFSEKQKQEFEHMLNAFTYGVPPHGGIAPGVDRFLMTVLGEPSVREVMAYPTSASGQISVMDAPSEATSGQLDELGIALATNTQDVYMRITKELDRMRINYKAYEHEPVHTSEEAAKVRGTPLSLGAKAILMYADEKPIMVAVSGDSKIDFKMFKVFSGIKDLRMASPDEVFKVTGVKIGAVPPYGHIFGISLYLDDKIKKNNKLVFNAGLHDKSIEINYKDFEKVTKPIVGSFSKNLIINEKEKF